MLLSVQESRASWGRHTFLPLPEIRAEGWHVSGSKHVHHGEPEGRGQVGRDLSLCSVQLDFMELLL